MLISTKIKKFEKFKGYSQSREKLKEAIRLPLKVNWDAKYKAVEKLARWRHFLFELTLNIERKRRRNQTNPSDINLH